MLNKTTFATATFAAVVLLFAQNLQAQTTTVVGSIPAEFDVVSGAATYSIPIAVAPGRGGMQPELSLNYSSNGGNGILGVGWSLGGLSAIHRCPATLAQDGFVGGINFDGDDRYCLDGQRLIPIPHPQGGLSNAFRTEVDNYSEIRGYGGSISYDRNGAQVYINPSSFVVKTKSGQRITYGTNTASHNFPQGTMVWSVQSINDTTNNNSITFTYFNDQNAHYLDEINYVGGRVDLVYETADRPDIKENYFQGTKSTFRKRLEQLVTFSSTSEIQTYSMDYENVGVGQISQLNEVHLCDDNQNCLDTIELSWVNGSTSNYFAYDNSTPGSSSSSSKLYFNDYNGDGVTDYIVHTRSGNNGTFSTYLGNGDGTFGSVAWQGSVPTGDHTDFYFNDYNGDGITDYILHDYGWYNGYFRVYLGNGDGSFGSLAWEGGGADGTNTEFYFNDYNGDGILDYILHDYGWHGGQFQVRLGNGDGSFGGVAWQGGGSSGTNTEFYFNDYNGDGITDYILHDYGWHSGQFQVHLGNGDGSFGGVVWQGGGSTGTNTEFYFNDYNGDGITDYILHDYGWHSGQFQVHIGEGDGSFSGVVWQGGGSHGTNTKFYFNDYNGDGITDYILHDYGWFGGNFRAYLGNGDGSFGGIAWEGGGSSGTNTKFYFNDYNGDGITDYVLHDYGWYSGQLRVYTNNNLANKHVVNSITNSTGNTTQLTYKPLTDSTVYTKGTGAAYPIQDLQYPQYVVSQVETSNGIGGTTTVNYQYEGLKAHLRGRGSLGYARITESYPDTNKTLETNFYQSGGSYESATSADPGYSSGFPYIGSVVSVVESYNGNPVNTSDNIYFPPVPHPLHTNVYQLNLQETVQRSYELGNSTTPVTTVTNTHSGIDGYGNIGTVTVTTSGGGQTFTKITNSTYEPANTTDWILGRLSDTTVIHQSPYGPDETRRSSFTYASNTGLLLTETIEDAAGNPLNTTTYGYDAYGQKTSVTLSATGETSRATTTTYNTEGKPTQSCNALGQCETYTYTPEGWLASTTGPNSITTSWTYDGFGRKIREDRADGTWTTINRYFASSGNCVPTTGGDLSSAAYSCVVTESSATPPAYVQLDRLGREVRKIKPGFDERYVYSDVEYNHLAQVSRVSRDYYLGNHTYWATSEYDALDRVTRATEPGPHGTVNEILTTYNGLVTAVTSGPEARVKTTTTNAIGQKTRIDEETGTYTEYTYNSDGNLLTTRVAGDVDTTITLSYDDYGRKIGMDDPDMGVWSYSYNAFGELISQTDAKSQTVTMQYDVLGRMTSRTEPIPSGTATSTWVYGDNAAPAGSIGKLLQESGNGLTKDFSYDSLGRPTSTTTTIGSDSFTTETSYDSLGRVSRTTYPGTQAFYTENQYNANGFLAAITGSRSQAEQHDYTALQPLITQATDLADDYLAKAQQFANLGSFYQSRIDNYATLLAQQTIVFESGTTSGLDQNRPYDYLSAGDGQTYYIRVPDTFVPIGVDIITPIILPAEYHYRVVDTNGTQTITQITAAEFDALSAGLTDTGDHVYALDNTTITCACDAVQHEQYLANLQSHQALLSDTITTGQPTGVNTNMGFIPIVNGDIVIPLVHFQSSMALPPELLAHISNTLVELQTVQSLISQQAQSYADSAAQLTVLAEQTLAAADHNYQFVRTLDNSAAVYAQFDTESSTDTITYWRAVDVDASGRISAEVYGNGVVNDYAYNQGTGQLQSIHSSLLVVDAVRHLEYQYDAYQNVTLRDDLVNDIRETYDYDRLDRLTATHVSSQLYDTADFNNTQSLSYDLLGNITDKSDVGSYSYGAGAAGPHAVTQAGGNTYAYDANGNMTSGAGRTIQWSSFNKPTQITQNGRSATFTYGPDRARYQKVNHQGDTTLYVGGLYERLTKNSGAVDQKHYIYAAGQLVAEHIVSTTEGTQTRYLHKDALGSVDMVTDAYANVVDRRSFDAWGKLRNLPWQSQAGLDDPLYLTQLPFTNKGFTGHEHVQEVNLIHMNGRMYDATLARFISADPHIQAGSLSQNYNRYSYVMNNPLKYTDPSGYFFKKLFKKVKRAVKKLGRALKKAWDNPWVRLGLAIAAGWYAGKLAFKYGFEATWSLAGAKIYGGVAGGFVGGLVASGGNLESAVIGAATGGLAGWIGESVRGLTNKALAHGLVGGSASVLQGGKFGHGFASSFFTKMVSNPVHKFASDVAGKSQAARHMLGAASAAMIGGTASKLGGGKFTNGARTAAFLTIAQGLPSVYKKIVGYELDMGPGGAAAEKGLFGYPEEGANNVGTQRRWQFDENGDRIIGWAEEGSAGSNFLNQIPGVNAVAGIHDVMQVNLGRIHPVVRDVLNFPGMVPAAALTYTTALSQPLTHLNTEQIVNIATTYSRNKERDRNKQLPYVVGY